MFRVSLAFVALASACLVCGVSIGIHMGAERDFALAPVHAHLNLLGWVSLAVYGLAYRVYPELTRPRVAIAHFAISGAGAILFPIGLYLEIFHESAAVIAVAAPLWLAGAAVFFVLVMRFLFTSRAPAATRGDIAPPRPAARPLNTSPRRNPTPPSYE